MMLARKFEEADAAGLVREQVRSAARRHRRFVVAYRLTGVQEPA